MKITYPIVQTDGSVTIRSIPFTTDHKGTYKALVPVRYPGTGVPGDSRQLRAAVNLQISSSTTTNTKGHTRTMLKVSLPYRTVKSDADASTPLVLDPNRAGTIEAHVVLNSSKAVREDLSGANGGHAQRMAASQVAASLHMLAAMIGETVSFNDVSKLTYDAQGSATYENLVGTHSHSAVLAEGGTLDESEVAGTVSTNQADFGGITLMDDQVYGQTGLNLTDSTQVSNNLRSPFVRGLNGLEPLAEENSIPLPYIVL